MESLTRLFTTTAPDFNVLWTASKDLLTSNNPYLNSKIFTGVGYPPNSLLFYLPLTNFSYLVAQNIFTVLSIVSILVSILLTLKILKIKYNFILFLILFLLTLLSFPTKFTLGMGQNNFIALSLILASFYFFKSKKIILSSILLGLVISLKTIFIYFLIFFVIKKQWKIVVSSLAIILFSVLIVYLIRGNFDLYTYYLTDVLPPLFRFEDREIYYNQGISGFISRIVTDLELRKNLTMIVSVVLISINAYMVLVKKNLNLLFSLTTITLLLIDSLAWQHHFVWLLFPFIVLWQHKSKSYLKYLLIASYILVSLNVPEIKYLSSHLFFGTLILYGMNVKYLL